MVFSAAPVILLQGKGCDVREHALVLQVRVDYMASFRYNCTRWYEPRTCTAPQGSVLDPRAVAPPYAIMAGEPAVVVGDMSLLTEALAPVEGAAALAEAAATAGVR